VSTDDIHRDRDFNEAVANQVAAYAKLFEAQVEVTHSWPEKFHFPEPSNDIEREAMRFFIYGVERKMRMMAPAGALESSVNCSPTICSPTASGGRAKATIRARSRG